MNKVIEIRMPLALTVNVKKGVYYVDGEFVFKVSDEFMGEDLKEMITVLDTKEILV